MLVCRFSIQRGNAAKENRCFQLGDIIANLFCVNCHQCSANKKWQLFVVVCVLAGERQTQRDAILVWMMCLYQSSVLADGLLNPSDTVCMCVCVCERETQKPAGATVSDS